MFIFKPCSQLIVAGNLDQRAFIEQVPQQADACGTSLLVESVWHDQAGMPCQVGHQHLVSSKRRGNDHIVILEQAVHLADQ